MQGDMNLVVTQAFNEWRGGDPSTKMGAKMSLDATLVGELNRLAREHMRRENSSHTLQATALVNEAFIRLVDVDVDWQDKRHFMAVASRTMRRILVDHAKAKNSHKRRANKESVTFEDAVIPHHENVEELILLDDLLQKLANFDERSASMLELSLFGGLTQQEVADVLEVSIATVERDMRSAKAWLRCQ